MHAVKENMKNPIVLLVLSIITFSCSSIKQDYNVINDFLETELANKKIDTLFLKIKGPNRIEGLKKYEQAFKERNYSKHALRLNVDRTTIKSLANRQP